MVTETADDIEAIIAKTALKYDLLPYASNPFPQSQPARIGAIAKLFGLDIAPVENARVLELGCASAGNIIPLAMRYHKAEFVGVDLSRTQVAAGRARIAALKLKNIRILCQSFTEIGDDLGSFDYIICHGVFSWVPAPVREAILRIMHERLSPVGVGFVSYNVLPGWRAMQALRDAFLLEIPDQHNSLARVQQALSLLDFLAAASPGTTPYKQTLQAWAERLKTLPPDYVAHEFLEETNEPCTVRSFVNLAQEQGLAFLGEADLPSMILDNLGEATAQMIRQRTANDILSTEQTRDLVTGRTFRESLVVAASRASLINRNLSSDSMAGFHFSGSASLTLEVKDNTYILSDGTGRTLTSSSPAVGKALAQLVDAFPASLSLENMIEGANSHDQAAVSQTLLNMTLAGFCTLLTSPVMAASSASSQPLACPLVQADLAAGSGQTTNLRHERVVIDAAAGVILAFADGTRSVDELAVKLCDAAANGKLTFQRDGKPILNKEEIQTTAKEYIIPLLSGMTRSGLMIS